MRTYDDDDEEPESWRGSDDDDAIDEYPDEADTSIEGGNVKCVHCGTYIHEDADMCPRCHKWQTDDQTPPPKPRWFVLTVILLVLALSGVLGVVYFFGRPI